MNPANLRVARYGPNTRGRGARTIPMHRLPWYYGACDRTPFFEGYGHPLGSPQLQSQVETKAILLQLGDDPSLQQPSDRFINLISANADSIQIIYQTVEVDLIRTSS